MPAIHETAYPRLKSSPTHQDLVDVYTPSRAELTLAHAIAKGSSAKLGFLTLLKTFQRLGYFVQLQSVPKPIIDHIAQLLGDDIELDVLVYDSSGTRRRHVSKIRSYLSIKPYDQSGENLLGMVMSEAALTKEALADIINAGIEELIRQRYELLGFSTLVKRARQFRTTVNQGIYSQVSAQLGKSGCNKLDNLLRVEEDESYSSWELLKSEPGKATLSHLRSWVSRLQWLTDPPPKKWTVSLSGLF